MIRGTKFLPNIALAILVAAGASFAQSSIDWPQWRGATRNAEALGFEPPAEWPSELALAWQQEIGRGDSSPVVAGGTIFTFTREGDDEVTSARRLLDGELIWQQRYAAPFKPFDTVRDHGAGPYSTPTFADGKLFTYGIREVLTAWNGANGEQLWQREWSGEFKLTQPLYGASQSPLVAGGKLIVHVGGPGAGALLALETSTGRDLWRAPGDGPAYGSPIAIEAGGVEMVVTLTQRKLIGVALADGKPLWQQSFQVTFDVTSLTPLYHDGLLMLSGTDTPLRAWRIEADNGAFRLVEVWSNADAAMQFSSPVATHGRIYGFSHKNKGQLVALDAATGKTLFTGPARRGENAWLVAAADVVLVLYADGELEVLSVEDSEHRPLRTYVVSESAVWAYPAVLDRHVLVKGAKDLRLWEILPAPR
jgi:outer membrane protein assembly factor BamB